MNTKKIFVIASVSCALFACSSDEQLSMEVQTERVATVGSGNLSVAEVRDYIASRPMAAHQKVTADALEARVGEMVTAEVLYQEALRLKLDQQPAMRLNIRRMLAHELLIEKVERPVSTREISDQELQEYFDQYRFDYTRLEQLRLADIFIAVDESASTDERAQKAELAAQVLNEALSRQGERFSFSELIRNYSGKHPRYAIGDTGFIDSEGMPVGIDSKLANAAFTLSRNGQLLEQVVETPLGYHVIMRVGHRGAIEKNYMDVRDELEQKIRREELDLQRRAYVDELRKNTRINIDTDQLDKLANELQAINSRAVSDAATPTSGNSSFPPPLLPNE